MSLFLYLFIYLLYILYLLFIIQWNSVTCTGLVNLSTVLATFACKRELLTVYDLALLPIDPHAKLPGHELEVAPVPVKGYIHSKKSHMNQIVPK